MIDGLATARFSHTFVIEKVFSVNIWLSRDRESATLSTTCPVRGGWKCWHTSALTWTPYRVP